MTLGVCAPYPLHNRCIPYSSSKIECKDIPLVLVSLGRVGTSSSPSPSFLHTLASAASRTLSWSRGRSVPPPQCHRWSDPSDLLLGLERNSSKKYQRLTFYLEKYSSYVDSTYTHTHLDLSIACPDILCQNRALQAAKCKGPGYYMSTHPSYQCFTSLMTFSEATGFLSPLAFC